MYFDSTQINSLTPNVYGTFSKCPQHYPPPKRLIANYCNIFSDEKISYCCFVSYQMDLSDYESDTLSNDQKQQHAFTAVKSLLHYQNTAK